MHMAGHGTDKDYAKALTYLNAAVGQGGYGRETGLLRDMRSSAAFFLGEPSHPACFHAALRLLWWRLACRCSCGVSGRAATAGGWPRDGLVGDMRTHARVCPR